MTNSSSHSDETVTYQTTVERAAASEKGVTYRIRRMTFGQRIELTRRVHELARRIEFAEAGETFADKVEAGLLALEADRLYLEWGLAAVDGLEIDGEPATVERFADRAPEALSREIIAQIKAECGLSEAERKN